MRIKRVVFIFFLSIFFLLIIHIFPSKGYASFFKYSNNPILPVGGINDWDNKIVSGPSLIFENGLYRLWYYGSNGNKVQIGYADSTSPFSFTKSVNNPIILWNKVSNEDIGVEQPSVLTNSIPPYKLWFDNANNSIQAFRLFYISSPDGYIWTNPPAELIFDISTSWESRGMAAPTVVYNYFDNLYRLWYVGEDNSSVWRIGYATSNDGIHWTKYPEPVLVADKSWEGPNLGNPMVLREDGLYHMWYHASGGIGHATSSDGINWEKDKENPVLKPGPGQWENKRILNPFVLKKDGISYLYYTGESYDGRWQIGLATSVPITPYPTYSPTPTSIIPVNTTTPTPTGIPTIIPTITNTPTPSSMPTAIPSLTPIPTVTTTPENTSSYPIVILLGLGVSWNVHAMFSCNLDNSNIGRWTLAPYVLVYQRLINTLTRNAKLRLNRDVYIYAYDWRQPLDRQAQDFKKYLDGILTGKPAGTKVKLIGHSLGGLVIRSYLANNPINHRVAKALTIGTPHQGSVLAYPAWEKGEVWTDNNLIKIALFQLINYCKYIRPSLTDRRNTTAFRLRNPREIIQVIAPVIKDLLPVFNYLRKNGQMIETSKLQHQNSWINSHPFPDNFYSAFLSTLSGSNIPTLRFLEVADPDSEEKKSGDWQDGKPIGSEMSDKGDGTVLLLSSQITGLKNIDLEGDHGSIISSADAIREILAFLDLPKVKISSEISLPETTSKRFLTFSIDTEVKMEISAFSGQTLSSEEGIIVDYAPRVGLYRLTLKPKQSGMSNLYLMEFTENKVPKTESFALDLKKDQVTQYLLVNNPVRPFQLIPTR